MNSKLRQQKLLDILKYQHSFLTVQNLSDQLHTSKRTIHNDLSYLASQGIQFEKKSGVGIRLSTMSEPLIKEEDEYSPTYRRFAIIKRLLFKGEIITYQKLSEEYLVSVSSIIADVHHIKEHLLNDASVRLISSESGTKFEGNERMWQNTMIAFNEIILKQAGHIYLKSEILETLKAYYDETLLQKCYEMIESLKEYNVQSAGDYYLFKIFNACLVLFDRLSQGNHQDAQEMVLHSDKIMSLMSYLMAKDILDMMDTKIGINFKEEDIVYLSMVLTANRISFVASKVFIENQYKDISVKMIERLSNIVDVDLSNDKDLIRNVSIHVGAMIYRLKNKIHIQNPMLNEIKKEYHLMFGLTRLITDVINEEICIALNEDEIGFLMLHFQNALEKQKKIKKILVVCPYGTTTSNIIANRIASILPPLDIIEVASMDDVKELDLKGIDFIVSTIPLENIEKPVVVVSMLLNDNDVNMIEQLYKESRMKKFKKQDHFKKQFQHYLDVEHIYMNLQKITKEEMIHQVCQQLVKEEIVTQDYEQSVLDREKEGGTDIISQGAIPHGMTQHVLKTKVVLWINKEPIKWSKYKVKVVVFFVLHQEDVKKAKEILEEVFALIKTKESVEKLSSMKSKDEVISYIYGG